MEEVLKKCPYCGGNGIYIVDRLEGIYITCRNCKVRTAGYFDERNHEGVNAISKVREAWNKRTEIG